MILFDSDSNIYSYEVYVINTTFDEYTSLVVNATTHDVTSMR